MDIWLHSIANIETEALKLIFFLFNFLQYFWSDNWFSWVLINDFWVEVFNEVLLGDELCLYLTIHQLLHVEALEELVAKYFLSIALLS